MLIGLLGQRTGDGIGVGGTVVPVRLHLVEITDENGAHQHIVDEDLALCDLDLAQVGGAVRVGVRNHGLTSGVPLGGCRTDDGHDRALAGADRPRGDQGHELVGLLERGQDLPGERLQEEGVVIARGQVLTQPRDVGVSHCCSPVSVVNQKWVLVRRTPVLLTPTPSPGAAGCPPKRAGTDIDDRCQAFCWLPTGSPRIRRLPSRRRLVV